jgi:hypothetical protein
MDLEKVSRLVSRVLAVHDASTTPYDREEIDRLVRWDPELFVRFHRRASQGVYLRAQEITRSERLWIALNLTRIVEVSPRCYFCDETFTRADVLAGNVHLEHFIARSTGGEHHPANITLACDRCNRLKGNLQTDDFERMLKEPEQFFVDNARLRNQRERLLAFAEISAPHYKGLSWIGERFGVPNTEWRRTWEVLRTSYRRNWT